MASSITCTHCSGPVISDPDTYTMVCSSCGIQHSSTDSFIADFPSSLSSTLVSNDFTYLQRKVYHAELLIQDITSRLNLSSRYQETVKLVSLITENSFGTGDWFTDLVAAAAYIVSRQNHLSLSISEAAVVAGSDDRRVGRMVQRVLTFLQDSKDIPGFNAVVALERGVREGASMEGIEEEKKEEMIAMGRFLVQCMMKWFLMTGRRPLPAVAAVVALVMEVCGIKVEFEDVCRDFYANVRTSTVRLKELKETLVNVAREVLPWGKDVNVKNLVQNMPVLIRVMEAKSKMSKKRKVAEIDFDKHLAAFHNVVDEDDYRSDYFGGRQHEEVNFDESNSSMISEERLFNAYNNALNRITEYNGLGKLNGSQGKKRARKEMEVEGFWDSWEGKFDLGKNLSLKQIFNRDIGYEALPPSFVKGIESRKRRKAKIKAAKKRINKIVDPLSSRDSISPEEDKNTEKQNSKKRSTISNGLDREDCIIELLLLHKVHEEEIEQGQYIRLLDLYVFTSSGI